VHKRGRRVTHRNSIHLSFPVLRNVRSISGPGEGGGAEACAEEREEKDSCFLVLGCCLALRMLPSSRLLPGSENAACLSAAIAARIQPETSALKDTHTA